MEAWFACIIGSMTISVFAKTACCANPVTALSAIGLLNRAGLLHRATVKAISNYANLICTVCPVPISYSSVEITFLRKGSFWQPILALPSTDPVTIPCADPAVCLIRPLYPPHGLVSQPGTSLRGLSWHFVKFVGTAGGYRGYTLYPPPTAGAEIHAYAFSASWCC